MNHLANDLYDALRKCSSEICVVDCSLDKPVRLTKKQVLIIATAFSKQLKKESSKRIGIAIPPSGLGLIVNLVVLFAKSKHQMCTHTSQSDTKVFRLSMATKHNRLS